VGGTDAGVQVWRLAAAGVPGGADTMGPGNPAHVVNPAGPSVLAGRVGSCGRLHGAGPRPEWFEDEFAQPAAADREPVFWSSATAQLFPEDNFVQADAVPQNRLKGPG
jgi:hypothetical protein